MAKAFKDLQPHDVLYYVSPMDLEIKDTLVEKVAPPSKKFVGFLLVNVVKNMTHVDDRFTADKLIEARDAAGANINQMIWLPMNEMFCIMGQQVPTVICTDKKMLKQWMERTAG